MHRNAADYIDRYLGLYFPNAVTDDGFDWHLLCGANGGNAAARRSPPSTSA